MGVEECDPLNVKRGAFVSENEWGIPELEPTGVEVDKLIPFACSRERDGFAHFFLDDYRFERVWNWPAKYADLLRSYKGVLTPDFSLYRDYPLAAQLWNTYRNRWVGAWCQQCLGLPVIPTISWSDERSYPFAFAGVQRGTTVAVSSVGIVSAIDRDLFARGYQAMIEVLAPSRVLWYGRLLDEVEGLANIKRFACFTEVRFDGRKR